MSNENNREHDSHRNPFTAFRNLLRFISLVHFVAAIWYLLHEANPDLHEKQNKPLFWFSIALLILILLRLINLIWWKVATNYAPHLLAVNTWRHKSYIALFIVSNFGEFPIGIYLWSQMAAEGVLVMDVNSVSRSFLEYQYYWFILVSTILFLSIIPLTMAIIMCCSPRETPRRDGLPTEILQTKTTITKLQDMAKELLETSPECCICFEPYILEDQIRKLNCGHFFHMKCIDEWLVGKGTCPFCRQRIENAEDRRAISV